MAARTGLALCALRLAALPLTGCGDGDGALPHTALGRSRAALSGSEQTVWVVLKERAAPAPAAELADWSARGRAVYTELKTKAESSQARLVRWLEERGARYKPFWIVDALQVTADAELVLELAAQPDVLRVSVDEPIRIPLPAPLASDSSFDEEWNLKDIGADLAWSDFGARGEGVVVANIDSGVAFTHPALARQYRGAAPGGEVDHAYSWFDPTGVCGDVPCDNLSHGTHTMGIMVGDDAVTNHVGVAPGARWIAAKGCESEDCSLENLLAAGQWILAPTDANGGDPRPELRPHVVNNSWAFGSGNDFYREIVQAWVRAGIFPVFAAGNEGSSCSSVGSPGDYPESYAVGYYDEYHAAATSSSRGPSLIDGGIKPNITAPGVRVKSSVPGGGYELMRGSSMASPHVAGAVALLWSALPELLGKVAETRALLDETAIDALDASCGADRELNAGNNNTFGQGRLDVYAALDRAPRGPSGLARGLVVDASGLPIAGATVSARGASQRATRTGADGSFALRLPAGAYELGASGFGYESAPPSAATITDGESTTLELRLTASARFGLEGDVRDASGAPLEFQRMRLLGTPLAAVVSDALGHYAFADVPEGDYQLGVSGEPCFEPKAVPVALHSSQTVALGLDPKRDGFGYECRQVAFAPAPAASLLPLSGDDESLLLELPFPFPFYGRVYSRAQITTNGYLAFGTDEDVAYDNVAIPDPLPPNAAIFALWDDLLVDTGFAASMRSEVLGDAPERSLVIEWHAAAFLDDFSQKLTLQLVLRENGEIVIAYGDQEPGTLGSGASATVGLEDASGEQGFSLLHNRALIEPHTAFRFLPPAGPAGAVALP
jgi:subtilisin family serine protease